LPPAVPRLRLEEPNLRLQTVALMAPAADVARASVAQAAASPAELTAAAMATRLQTLDGEIQAQRAATEQMRVRLAQAEDRGRWLPVLAAVVSVLTLVAGWQAWRMRALHKREAWWQGVAESAQSRLPLADEPTPLLPPADALPPQPSPQALPTRPASVDELIDLEQQAEFFAVLGEDDAALGLLTTHLRNGSDSGPWPYLQLLEIHRGRNDREAYEQVCEHHLARFGVSPPPWRPLPPACSGLQDQMAAVERLQACWSEPLQAMDELESLLFHRRGGEILDLHSYRDVLTLYAVARDLHRRPDVAATVDVLLPLIESEWVAAGSMHNSLADTAGQLLLDLDLSEQPPSLQSHAGGRRATLP
jgi:pilus assembly protein FimV